MKKGEEASASKNISGTRGVATSPQSQQRQRANTGSPYELTTDDSFSDERFASSASWEARSFDSEEQQQQQRKLKKQHDRRKQYDTTTPTLIDEEDEDETEILLLNTNSFEQHRDAEGGGMRRTPGATMYKSAYSQDDSANSSMRRTPGASAMYRIETTSSNGSEKQQPAGLGFGLTLSTPVANEQDHPNHPPTHEKKDRPWDSYDSSPQSEETDKVKPEPRGPFSFAPWARSNNTEDSRSGSFSPHILRLTEDIGNLLQDEEDDEYAVDLPSVFPGTDSSGWSNQYHHRNTQQPSVPYRKSSPINTPKPRRNEIVGGFRRQGVEKKNLVLGGAFAPPQADLFSNRPRGGSFSMEQQQHQVELNPNQQSRSFEWPYAAQPNYGSYSEMQATASVFVPCSTAPPFAGGDQQQQPWGGGGEAMREAWQQGAVATVYPPQVAPGFGARSSPNFWHGGQQHPDLYTAQAPPVHSQQGIITTNSLTGEQPESNSLRGRKEARRRQQVQRSRQTHTKKRGEKKKGHFSLSTSPDAAGSEELQASASEIEVKKGELVESPQTRIAFKEFYRAFRGKERQSFQEAEEFALQVLEDETFPHSVHWKVYLELADLAKRSNRYIEARCLYQKVCQLQPYASQGWLEFSKLEEECGNMNRVSNILHNGLAYCDLNENLLTRAVKHQEKMGNITNARGLLSRLKNVGVDKVWRTVLEGALLELRAGRTLTARRVLKYLMHHVPWYGPLYLEAYRLEKDQGHALDALHIVERGLHAIPRYGPLWFGAFRLCEEIDTGKQLYHLPTCINMIERATASISKELVWKVHLEASQMLERAAIEQSRIDGSSFESLIYPARRRVGTTVLTCPNNLRWKVWLTAARVELGSGNTERARALFLRAHAVVPQKGRSSTLIEFARLEEFVGEIELARAILCKGRSCYGNDWKVWLESVLLEIRSHHHSRAIEICNRALGIHHGTGRLWATLVQLRQVVDDDSAQYSSLSRALSAVPKSGEVWCEGGRIHLNPFSRTFDLVRARRHLGFATRFTPQYGDGFVETIRLELVEQWLQPIADYVWETTKSSFLGCKGSLHENLAKYVADVTLTLSHTSGPQPSEDLLEQLSHKVILPEVRARVSPEEQEAVIDLSYVRLACVNADPNYGLLWFHCRQRVTDTPRRIIEDAASILVQELRKYSHLYLAAMLRRKAVLCAVVAGEFTKADFAMNEVQRERFMDTQLRSAPSLSDMGLGSAARFATAVTTQHPPQSPLERKSMLFGNDALFP